jgi:type I restriction enzyme R subunit
MAIRDEHNSEWLTRKRRIDPVLNGLGWNLRAAGSGAFRLEEYETANGPADYALGIDDKFAGIVEAKKLTLGPQNVLTQAERYSKGAITNPLRYGEYHVPFLYSTNGEVIWFRDVRHALNRSRRVASFHTPNCLTELMERDFDGALARLGTMPNDHPRLRPYQREANTAVEQAIADRKREMMIAQATGCGKTFQSVNQIYRLMKSGIARRVLFLVDRRALAAQAVRAFKSFEPEPGLKFDQIYELFSQRFQQSDFGEDEKFDPTVLPQNYLTDPQLGHAFIYVCTIQRMAMNILGRNAAGVLGAEGEAPDEDADKLPIPIHAFDVIIADECHRGYSAGEVSVWRDTLDHFDAIKIGLTATPASHTVAYFKEIVYGYQRMDCARPCGRGTEARRLSRCLRTVRQKQSAAHRSDPNPSRSPEGLVNRRAQGTPRKTHALAREVCARSSPEGIRIGKGQGAGGHHQHGEACGGRGQPASYRRRTSRQGVCHAHRQEGIFTPAAEMARSYPQSPCRQFDH